MSQKKTPAERKATRVAICKRYTERHPDRVKASTTRYRKAHPENIKRWRELNPDRHAELNRMSYARVKAAAPEQFRLKENLRSMRSAQRRLERLAGRPKATHCEACGVAFQDEHFRRGFFDHDHATGKFRGWICRECNFTLGHAKDDTERLKRLIVYLEKHR